MDVGGINRLKPLMGTIATDVRSKTSTTTERDAHGHSGYQQKERPKHLTPEQEQEAVAALNALPSFAGAGLVAEIQREAGKPVHVVVRDRTGAIVRHLPYDQVVELYLARKSDRQTGRLINKAA